MARSQVKIKQTAGRDALGEFAPEFAHLNDDILFGEVWSRNDLLSLRDRSIVTVVVLMSQGLIDSSFKYHLESAKKNGVTKTEMAEILTHAAFYAGWPKAWAAFRMAKEVWTENADSAADLMSGTLGGNLQVCAVYLFFFCHTAPPLVHILAEDFADQLVQNIHDHKQNHTDRRGIAHFIADPAVVIGVVHNGVCLVIGTGEAHQIL